MRNVSNRCFAVTREAARRSRERQTQARRLSTRPTTHQEHRDVYPMDPATVGGRRSRSFLLTANARLRAFH